MGGDPDEAVSVCSRLTWETSLSHQSPLGQNFHGLQGQRNHQLPREDLSRSLHADHVCICR